MKNYLIGGLIVVVIFLGYWAFKPQQNYGFAPGWEGAYSSGVTHSTVTVGLATTGTSVALSNTVLATNTERQYARCMNINTNGFPVSLMLGDTSTSTALHGIVLTPFASSTPNYFYEITSINPYTGAVYAYSQGTSTLSCVEK